MTYDERQINAKDACCTTCGKRYYFTDHQQTVCVACSKRS